MFLLLVVGALQPLLVKLSITTKITDLVSTMREKKLLQYLFLVEKEAKNNSNNVHVPVRQSFLLEKLRKSLSFSNEQ